MILFFFEKFNICLPPVLCRLWLDCLSNYLFIVYRTYIFHIYASEKSFVLVLENRLLTSDIFLRFYIEFVLVNSFAFLHTHRLQSTVQIKVKCFLLSFFFIFSTLCRA
jgi:hypothetical protein